MEIGLGSGSGNEDCRDLDQDVEELWMAKYKKQLFTMVGSRLRKIK
jgi:hypothetical protein